MVNCIEGNMKKVNCKEGYMAGGHNFWKNKLKEDPSDKKTN